MGMPVRMVPGMAMQCMAVVRTLAMLAVLRARMPGTFVLRSAVVRVPAEEFFKRSLVLVVLLHCPACSFASRRNSASSCLSQASRDRAAFAGIRKYRVSP